MGIDAVRDRPGHADRWPRPGDSGALLERFRRVRADSLRLAATLSPEDQCVQSMPDASPIKWHLAHTTWFFEALVLQPHLAGYRCFDPRFAHLFNSYYESLGSRHARDRRGLLTRPSHADVLSYRACVDGAVQALAAGGEAAGRFEALLELGLHHEQQHQELMLTDIKHAFYANPLRPAVQPGLAAPVMEPAPLTWLTAQGGVRQIGHHGTDFAFDNETPRHAVLLRPFALASRLVSNRDFLQFIDDGGYRRHEMWLSDGWAAVQAQGWQAPLYWERSEPGIGERGWRVFTLQGMQALNPGEPVSHLSFYEACAYASWAGARLPTEFEWEAAAQSWSGSEPILGAAWQWTRSSYDPYPGFEAWSGPIGEYNGKFMVGQQVLRGGSCATPPGHLRITYRNFFPPGARWQFAGLRLARDA